MLKYYGLKTKLTLRTSASTEFSHAGIKNQARRAFPHGLQKRKDTENVCMQHQKERFKAASEELDHIQHSASD